MRYKPSYNQRFLDLAKLSSIHCTFLTLVRKYLYQPFSPVSWFQQFPLAAASQNKVSRLKLQEHQKNSQKKSFFISMLCGKCSFRARGMERSREARRYCTSQSPAVQWGTRWPKVLFSASPLWEALHINGFLVQEAGKGYAHPISLPSDGEQLRLLLLLCNTGPQATCAARNSVLTSYKFVFNVFSSRQKNYHVFKCLLTKPQNILSNLNKLVNCIVLYLICTERLNSVPFHLHVIKMFKIENACFRKWRIPATTHSPLRKHLQL